MKIPDLNVWLAAAWGSHSAHAKAAAWLDLQEDTLAFCRITQMGLLRLLSNPAVMREEALTRTEAWDVYQQFNRDPRVQFLSEPDGLDPMWLQMTKQPDRAHKLWTDDYLTAVAFLADATLVTFDRALAARHPAVSTELLCMSSG